MKTILSALVLLSLLFSTGCASTAASKVLKALGNDPATVSVRVNGWGTVIEISRANPVLGMSSTVATDGSLNVQTSNVKVAAPAPLATPVASTKPVAPAKPSAPAKPATPPHAK